MATTRSGRLLQRTLQRASSSSHACPAACRRIQSSLTHRSRVSNRHFQIRRVAMHSVAGIANVFPLTALADIGFAVFAPWLAAMALLVYAWLDASRKTRTPDLLYQETDFNKKILSRLPTLRNLYRPRMFLTNGHVETIWAAKMRQRCPLEYKRESIITPDGGVVALDWRLTPPNEKALDDDAPVLVLLPGLTGGSDDTYVRYAVQYAEHHGCRAVVFNSRGCGDTCLATPQFYSGVYIKDLEQVVAHVHGCYPNSTLFAAGWSLGANILVNYLGTVGEATPIAAAAAMCNPFDLTLGSENFQKGFNKVYDRNLAQAMSRIMAKNRKVWNSAGPEFDVETACNAPSVRAWDEAVTRVSFGFPSVDAYYAAAGSYQRVGNVRVPLLVIQAEDDPIAPIEATPKEALLANENCILAVTPTGGHLGWVAGEGGYFGEPWTDRVIVEWFLSLQVQFGLKTSSAASQAQLDDGTEAAADTLSPSVGSAQCTDEIADSDATAAMSGVRASSDGQQEMDTGEHPPRISPSKSWCTDSNSAAQVSARRAWGALSEEKPSLATSECLEGVHNHTDGAGWGGDGCSAEAAAEPPCASPAVHRALLEAIGDTREKVERAEVDEALAAVYRKVGASCIRSGSQRSGEGRWGVGSAVSGSCSDVRQRGSSVSSRNSLWWNDP